MTRPDAAAWIGVPVAAPMSIPSCIRPQRIPKPLVTGPLTGQISPLGDGGALGRERGFLLHLLAHVGAGRGELPRAHPLRDRQPLTARDQLQLERLLLLRPLRDEPGLGRDLVAERLRPRPRALHLML